jgi:hypothetical protein
LLEPAVCISHCLSLLTQVERYIPNSIITKSVFLPPFKSAACNLFGACSYLHAALLNACFGVFSTGDLSILQYCKCCQNTRHISAAINTCPDSNLSQWTERFDCSPELNSNSCTSDFDVVLAVGMAFYDPMDLPAGVLETRLVSDMGSYTTFSAIQIVTVAVAACTSTFTMVPWGGIVLLRRVLRRERCGIRGAHRRGEGRVRSLGGRMHAWE